MTNQINHYKKIPFTVKTKILITMKKLLFIFLLATALLFGQRASAEITLAVIAPKAGEHLKSGQQLFDGARLAIKEVNDNGGINGKKLDLLTIDDRCDDRLALSTAEMLTLLKSKKIGLVIGPYCSNRFDEISAIYEKGKIFQIIPTTEAYQSGGTAKKGRIVLLGTKTQMSKDFFKFYNNNFAGLTVGFVYDGRPETGYADVAKTLYDEFRHYGKADRLKFYTLNQEELSTTKLAKKVVKDKVNIVFILGSKKHFEEFILAAKKKEPNLIIFTGKKMITESMLEDLEETANGLYTLDIPNLKDNLMFTESLVNLRLLGIEPEGLEAYSYVAVKLWSDLARQVKSFDYNKLSKAANSDSLKEKWGEFLMHSGSLGTVKYIIEIYKDGAFKQVY